MENESNCNAGGTEADIAGEVMMTLELCVVKYNNVNGKCKDPCKDIVKRYLVNKITGNFVEQVQQVEKKINEGKATPEVVEAQKIIVAEKKKDLEKLKEVPKAADLTDN